MWIGHRKRDSKADFSSVRRDVSSVDGSSSDAGLTLETSAFFYGGQFTSSTQLIKPNDLVILPTDAALQFL